MLLTWVLGKSSTINSLLDARDLARTVSNWFGQSGKRFL